MSALHRRPIQLQTLFVFYCADLEASRSFYDCCGLAMVSFSQRKMCAIELADARLELHRQPSLPMLVDVSRGFELRCPDPQAAIALLRLGGFGKGIGPDTWVTDPDGRRIQLIAQVR